MPPKLLPRSLFAWPFASFRYESVLRSLSEGSGPQISHIVGPLVAPDRDVMAAAVVRKQIETPRTPDERISAKVILVGLSMPVIPPIGAGVKPLQLASIEGDQRIRYAALASS
jgi:hypothetical protein